MRGRDSRSAKTEKQGRDDSIKQLSTQLHPTYIWCGKICRVGLYTKLFMLSSLPCFSALADLLSLHLVTLLMCFYSCLCHFFSSRCMLELNLAIYSREASLPQQASNAVLAQELLTRPSFLKIQYSPQTNSISN